MIDEWEGRPPIDPYAPVPPGAPIANANGAAGHPPVLNDVVNGAAAMEPAPAPTARPVTPCDIIRSWQGQGPIVRVPTGFATLDEACRGGLPIPWRLSIVGAPSAGKTAFAIVLAWALENAGLCIGILGIDEDPEDLNARLVQMAGFTIAQCESRDPQLLDEIARKLANIRVRFYDSTHTIENAADDLGTWAQAEGRKAAFLVDTVQTARAGGSHDARGPRELVEANAAALRAVTTKHRFLLMTLSEANRGSYRSEDAADTQNDMAAGAESRAIEFMAQTLVMLRTPKGYPDVVHVRVPKNRKGARAGFEFWLRLDRDRHKLTECQNPDEAPGVSQEKAQKARAANRAGLEQRALAVLRIISASPGIGERALRRELPLQGLKIGKDALATILMHLERSGRIENRVTLCGTREDSHYSPLPQDGSP